MNTSPNDPPRMRRPIPERTAPQRGILGIFGQSNWGDAPDPGHPLGPGFATDAHDLPDMDFIDESVRQASALVDDHIRKGAMDSTAQNDGFLDTLSTLYGAAQTADIAALATQATRTYSEITSLWVDLAGTLRDQLGQLRSTTASHPAGPQTAPIAGPALSIRTACPVEVRVDMFRASDGLTAQPLGAADPAQNCRITEVKIADGQLRITVPAAHPPGVYYGLLLDQDGGPAGAVTLEVFEPVDTDP